LSITSVLTLLPLVNTTQQTSEQRKKLRSLINLTRTVSGINNAGHPTLKHSSIKNKCDPKPKSSKGFSNILLNATATIFVRYQEVIALVASGGGIIAVEGRTEEITDGEPSLASQEMRAPAAESDFDGGGDDGNSGFRISRIATVVNPMVEDNYTFPADSQFMVLDSGKSHLRAISDENKAWELFLNIP
jgi:hypothetical protein